jgi:Amt family ammonium transporter
MATPTPTPAVAIASTSASVWPDGGDCAFMLSSTALVLIMTPGLAFFYAGMVLEKNRE